MNDDKSKVVILGRDDDIHSRSVSQHLREIGVCSAVIDTSQFPERLGCAWMLDASSTADPMEMVLQTQDSGGIRLSELRSIWFRRHRVPAPKPGFDDPVDRWLSGAESRHVLWGMAMTGAMSGVMAINDPAREVRARNKMVQLRAAAACGLDVPKTWIGNCPESARQFASSLWSAGGRVIAKHLEAPPTEAIYTRFFTPDQAANLSLLRGVPATLQEFVGGIDLRVSVVGDRVFAASILKDQPESEVDWRKEYLSRIEATRIDPALRERLLATMRALGLSMGMFDLKLTPDGRAVFLEVNAQGQFLFIEIQTGQPISRAVAYLLAGDTKGLSALEETT